MTSLAAFLRRIGTASYHAGTDDQVIGYLVNRSNEAWHLRNGNPAADGFVFCGFASWSTEEWFRHPVMLEHAAWWIESCSRERGIPLKWLSHAEIREALRNPNYPGGITHHHGYTLSARDGSHWDCGPNLPWQWILKRANEIRGGKDVPFMSEGGIEDMALNTKFKDWNGHEQTIESWMNNVDRRLAILFGDAPSDDRHAMRRVDGGHVLRTLEQRLTRIEEAIAALNK
jgi:hypothetical protein